MNLNDYPTPLTDAAMMAARNKPSEIAVEILDQCSRDLERKLAVETRERQIWQERRAAYRLLADPVTERDDALAKLTACRTALSNIAAGAETNARFGGDAADDNQSIALNWIADCANETLEQTK